MACRSLSLTLSSLMVIRCSQNSKSPPPPCVFFVTNSFHSYSGFLTMQLVSDFLSTGLNTHLSITVPINNTPNIMATPLCCTEANWSNRFWAQFPQRQWIQRHHKIWQCSMLRIFRSLPLPHFKSAVLLVFCLNMSELLWGATPQPRNPLPLLLVDT